MRKKEGLHYPFCLVIVYVCTFYKYFLYVPVHLFTSIVANTVCEGEQVSRYFATVYATKCMQFHKEIIC